jgi:hypothetical protein
LNEELTMKNEELKVENPFGDFLIAGASHLLKLSFAEQNILNSSFFILHSFILHSSFFIRIKWEALYS